MKKIFITKLAFVFTALLCVFAFEARADISLDDLKDYYFTGKIDLKKYPELNVCGYSEGFVSFHIFNSVIFGECEGDVDTMMLNIDGNYSLVTTDNIIIKLKSKKGKIENLSIISNKISNKENSKQNKLNLERDSCKISELIMKTKVTYNIDEMRKGYGKDYERYELGSESIIPSEPKSDEERYNSQFLFTDVFKYKNKILSAKSDMHGNISARNGKFCNKIFNFNNKELLPVNCSNEKISEIFLQTENCIVTKFEGKFNQSHNNKNRRL